MFSEFVKSPALTLVSNDRDRYEIKAFKIPLWTTQIKVDREGYIQCVGAEGRYRTVIDLGEPPKAREELLWDLKIAVKMDAQQVDKEFVK